MYFPGKIGHFLENGGIMLVKYVSIDGIPQTFVFFRFVDIIVITVHDRFWNIGQANCILKYFENMMIDHSHSNNDRFFLPR
jgi:hypothetical protein